MKTKLIVLIGAFLLILLISGFGIYRFLAPVEEKPETTETEQLSEVMIPLDKSVKVDVTESRNKDHTIILSIIGLASKMKSLSYEISYESEGLIKGVNSGSKEIDLSGSNNFEREVYLGTCSRNVCKPDTGVTKISVALVFTDNNGQKSQFSQDYDI